MKYSVRPASEDDLGQVASIEKKYFLQKPWTEESFRASLSKPFDHFWVLTDDETDSLVLGYVVFSLPAEQAHIQTIAIHPKYRRHGLGVYLLRQLISFVMRKKAESIVLEVRQDNSPAIQLYQKLGFVIIHRMKRFYPDGADAFSMIYKTERNKLTGDPEVDFDTPSEADLDRRKAPIN